MNVYTDGSCINNGKLTYGINWFGENDTRNISSERR